MRVLAAILALLVAFVPSAALANVMWPGLILADRQLAWWVIGLSLLIEMAFVRLAFGLSPLNTALATIAANAVTAAAGLAIVPLISALIEVGLQSSGIAAKIGWDAFSPAGWAMAVMIAYLFNVSVELLIYRYGYRLAVGRREARLIALANALTLAIAFGSLVMFPTEPF